MYRVYCDDVLIYNDIAGEQDVRLVAPTVEWSDNSSGSFTFTMPVVNTGYDKLVLMQSKIRILRDDVEIWEGRAIKETRDFWKNRNITCEGALGYLNDVIQPQREMPDDGAYVHFNATPREFLDIVLAYHNEQMRKIGRTDRLFATGDVTVTDTMKNEDPDGEYDPSIPEWKPTIYTDQKTTLELISEKLVSGKNQNGDDLEGHIRVRKGNDGIFYLDYLKDPVVLSDQVIEFGKNLLDFTRNYDETDFCTVLYPRGYSEGNSIGSMNAYLELSTDQNGHYERDGMSFTVDAPRIIFNGETATGQGGVNTFGWIERIYDQSDAQTEDDLLEKALHWFTKNRFADMELEIKAFDLGYLGVNAEFINFMENVRVRSLPHGLDTVFPVLNVSIPLDNPSQATFSLGKKKVQSLSTYSSSVNTDIKETKDFANARASSALDKALAESGDMIRSATTGKVCIIPTTGPSGTAEFLVIANFSDEQIQKFVSGEWDIRQAENPMWAWSMNGLGYFPRGLVSDPNVAMDMTGSINASMITTGVLNADLIKAGVIRGINIIGSNISGSYFHTPSTDDQDRPIPSVKLDKEGLSGIRPTADGTVSWIKIDYITQAWRPYTDGPYTIITTYNDDLMINGHGKKLIFTNSGVMYANSGTGTNSEIATKKDLDGFATTTYVDEAISGIEPGVSYNTMTAYVDNAIRNIKLDARDVSYTKPGGGSTTVERALDYLWPS